MHSGGSGPFRDLSPSQQLERVRLLKDVVDFIKYNWQVRLAGRPQTHTASDANWIRIDSRELVNTRCRCPASFFQ